MMKQGKFFKVNLAAACAALVCWAAPVFAADAPPLSAFAKAGFISLKNNSFNLQASRSSGAPGASLSGKSMGSINTIGFSQGEDFLKSVGRRQNKLHSFSKGKGTSEAFFGKDENFVSAQEGQGIMDFLLQNMNLSPEDAQALPQLWTDTISRKGKVEASNGFDSYEYDTSGFSGGLDIRADNDLSFGLAVGYSRSSSTFEALGETSTAVDGYHAALYTTIERDNATIDSALSFTLFQNSSERSLLNNEHENKANAKALGYQIGWSLSAMGHGTADGFALTPVAGFTFASLRNADLHETGAGTLDLKSEESNRFSLKPMLGLDVAKTYKVEEGVSLTPEVYGIYRYEMMGSEETARTRLASFNDITLTNPATQLSRHSMQLGASLTAKVGEALISKVQFDSDLQPSTQEFKVLFKLNYIW